MDEWTLTTVGAELNNAGIHAGGNERAARRVMAMGDVLKGLEAYADGHYSPDEPIEDILADFLGDVRHLCHKLDIEFNYVDGRGEAYFSEEH